jgi:ADP-ribose pyrophosphatase
MMMAAIMKPGNKNKNKNNKSVHSISILQHPLYKVAKLGLKKEEIPWENEFHDYELRRKYYMHENIKNNLKLDTDDPKRYAEGDSSQEEIFNQNLKNRITYINGHKQTLEEAGIKFDNNNLPKNPMGRTGMWGPGLLGKNGPNQAADPIFIRWRKITIVPFIHATSRFIKHVFSIIPEGILMVLAYDIYKSAYHMLPCLEMIVIQRKDTGEWAIPGGMVEAGETVSDTLRNEINQEACNNMDPDKASKAIDKILDKNKGKTIYQGYVDDPRNSDTRWMETTAVYYHCTGKLAKAIKLEAGDDAQKVKWLAMTDIEPDYKKLYASHKMMTDKAKSKIFTDTYNNFCKMFMLIYVVSIWSIIAMHNN